MEGENIISRKNKVIELIQSIINDYNLMNDKLLQQQNLSTIEIKSMNDIIQEQERISQSEFSNKQNMENEIKMLKKQNYDYEGIIRDLQDKVLEKQNEEKTNNKFNMMITQANELEAKDREIERLNKVVYNLKYPEENKIPVIDSLMNEVKEELRTPEPNVSLLNTIELLILKALPLNKSKCSDDVHESVELTQLKVLSVAPVSVKPPPSAAESFDAPLAKTTFLSSTVIVSVLSVVVVPLTVKFPVTTKL